MEREKKKVAGAVAFFLAPTKMAFKSSNNGRNMGEGVLDFGV